VQEAFKAARDLLQSKVTGWRYADSKIRDLVVTWDAENGEPMLDGEPMYPKAVES
jgi:hypothetical protein